MLLSGCNPLEKNICHFTSKKTLIRIFQGHQRSLINLGAARVFKQANVLLLHAILFLRNSIYSIHQYT